MNKTNMFDEFDIVIDAPVVRKIDTSALANKTAAEFGFIIRHYFPQNASMLPTSWGNKEVPPLELEKYANIEFYNVLEWGFIARNRVAKPSVSPFNIMSVLFANSYC